MLRKKKTLKEIYDKIDKKFDKLYTKDKSITTFVFDGTLDLIDNKGNRLTVEYVPWGETNFRK